ncbi:glycoside hydrolase [Rickenella mellea]|uniref:Beta-mannosidase B n=1 Tax=Rickenella mellea TaxID=50990 RepID=A0A4Y7PUY5_9AGAM|nr:glycoside hydrolase [Rickenella mellea]
MKIQAIELTKDWVWKERDKNGCPVLDEIVKFRSDWRPVQSMPSEVHVELMKINRIPDPYLGFNEHKVHWVGEREWLYATTISFDSNCQHEHAELLFEGLDTFCTVILNGEVILEADNQFRRYPIILDTKKLKPSNTLLLHFKSAKIIARDLEKKYGRVRAGSCNLGDPSRVYVRKAQYDWRWDWGPELMTVGPYRPVHFLTYTARILDFYPRTEVTSDYSFSLDVHLELRGSASAVRNAEVTLKDKDGSVIMREQNIISKFPDNEERDSKILHWDLGKDEVKLWWPVGYGDQNLYTVEVLLLSENSFVLDQQTKTVGFRRVKLVQEPLAHVDQYGNGTTFFFEINDVPIFIGGSNWIPADNFLTNIKPERYRAWLQLLKDGNQNMIRLWGGGVYEPDIFFEICDEMGILVWQDFQFACGVYPAHDEFVASVKAEAEDNVSRLRHHPSLALLCGNNEDYQQVLQWGDVEDLPARKLYEHVLPDVVSRLTNDDIPYHRGSPYGGKGWDTADPTVGDVHQWEIWAGLKNYQDYDIMGGRFVSEFGMPSMPDLRTIDYWLDGDTKQRFSQSKLMAQHNKAGSHERRFAVVMNENFRLTEDFEKHAYYTQVLQSEAMGHAYRSWRREWKGDGKRFTGGAIVWQLNDCWPVTSWAIADYFLRPKMAYYTIARELRPYTVGILRKVEKDRENDRPRQFYEFGAFQSKSAKVEVWGTNSTLAPREVLFKLSCFNLDPNSSWTCTQEKTVTLGANQSTEILNIPCPEPPLQNETDSDDTNNNSTTRSQSVVVSARLIEPKSDDVLARFADWPQPFRHVDFPTPGPQVRKKGDVLKVHVDNPVKGLVLNIHPISSDGPEVKWSDNAIDVMPDEDQIIVANGLGERSVAVSYMGAVEWHDFELVAS